MAPPRAAAASPPRAQDSTTGRRSPPRKPPALRQRVDQKDALLGHRSTARATERGTTPCSPTRRSCMVLSRRIGSRLRLTDRRGDGSDEGTKVCGGEEGGGDPPDQAGREGRRRGQAR